MGQLGRVMSVLSVCACATAAIVVSQADAATAHHHAVKRHPAKKKHAAPKTSEVPVTFSVRNTNTSRVPCPADGKSYTVSGHLVGPVSRLRAGTPQAVTLYVHGLGYGAFYWNYKGVPGYDYATQQAAGAGQVSVVIDRLGYGASGRPDGNQVCYGSEADYLHQIVQQLRSGDYSAAGKPARLAFDKVALASHSAAGYMAEGEILSYDDVDALILTAFGNTGVGPAGYASFARTTQDCMTDPLPGHYAYFGKTGQDFAAAHFFNADPAVVAKVTAMRAPDPCMDTGSAPQSVVTDLVGNGRVTQPVLIVNGADDALFPPPAGPDEKLLFAGDEDVSQVTLGASGHALTLGRTAPRFRSLVGTWLRAHGF